ncbi:hypothetical protein AC630_40470 [Bradyrhizobium sp. AS23.2]|nr:hypothetical protein AC630_40470 [Bradyrhizobium sp. AS23.2]
MGAFSPTASFVRSGGLASYSAKPEDIVRRTLAIVERIVDGVDPSTIPVEQPTAFEAILNLKTAKALGIQVPPSALMRVDRIIE